MHCHDYIKNLPDNYINLIILDPPYGNIVKDDWDREFTTSKAMTPEFITECFRVLKDSGNLYCFCGIGEKSQSLIEFFMLFHYNNLFKFKDLITWKKNRGIGMKKGWLYTREEILWYVKDNKKFQWNKENQYSNEKRNYIRKCGKTYYKRISNIWTDINEVGYGDNPYNYREKRQKINHSTPKPVDLIKRLILLHTKENDIVADFFLGSGSTIDACKDLNRNFVGCELNYNFYKNLIDKIT